MVACRNVGESGREHRRNEHTETGADDSLAMEASRTPGESDARAEMNRKRWIDLRRCRAAKCQAAIDSISIRRGGAIGRVPGASFEVTRVVFGISSLRCGSERVCGVKVKSRHHAPIALRHAGLLLNPQPEIQRKVAFNSPIVIEKAGVIIRAEIGIRGFVIAS